MRRSFFPLMPLVLGLAACQPSPFAHEEKEGSYAAPITAEDGSFVNGVARYRIQNIRTLPFAHAHQPYLLRETQRMVAGANPQTEIESSEIETQVFLQSLKDPSRTDRVWHKNFHADKAELLEPWTFSDFPLYRLTTFRANGFPDTMEYINAINGQPMGLGDSELAPVTLTDAKGETHLYVTVQSDRAAHTAPRPAHEAASIRLARASGPVSKLRLYSPKATEGTERESSQLLSFQGKKFTRLYPKHDKAAVMLKSIDGQTIWLPFDRSGFLPDKAKLPKGWRLEKAPD